MSSGPQSPSSSSSSPPCNSGHSCAAPATPYDASLQQWYQRMVSPNIGFLASYPNEQSQRWSSAILKKKYAMQIMLEAQKTIEEIEADVSQILNRETIEGMRSMFFRDILDSKPSIDGQYLMQLEEVTIQHSVSEHVDADVLV